MERKYSLSGLASNPAMGISNLDLNVVGADGSQGNPESSEGISIKDMLKMKKKTETSLNLLSDPQIINGFQSSFSSENEIMNIIKDTNDEINGVSIDLITGRLKKSKTNENVKHSKSKNSKSKNRKSKKSKVNKK